MRTVVADNAFKKCMTVRKPEKMKRQDAIMKELDLRSRIEACNPGGAQVLQPLGELCRLLGTGHLSATYRSFLHCKKRTLDMLSKNDFCDHRVGHPAETEATKRARFQARTERPRFDHVLDTC